MGRIRTIKPEFFTSRKVGQLSMAGRLAFIWLWTAADDAGNVEWDARLLRSGAFPFDDLLTEDSLSIQGALMRLGLVEVYEVGGQQFAHITGWEEHQRINRPSAPRCPAPVAGFVPLTEPSVSPPGARTEPSSPEGKGRELEGSGTEHPPTPPKGGDARTDAHAHEGAEPAPAKADPIPVAKIVDWWNRTMVPQGCPAVQKWASFERDLRARWTSCGATHEERRAGFYEHMRLVQASDWLMGRDGQRRKPLTLREVVRLKNWEAVENGEYAATANGPTNGVNAKGYVDGYDGRARMGSAGIRQYIYEEEQRERKQRALLEGYTVDQ